MAVTIMMTCASKFKHENKYVYEYLYVYVRV